MSNTVVIDANIALKWVLNEQDSDIATALLAEWTKKSITIIAPSLLLYEVTNILYRHVRTGKITPDTARAGIHTLLRAVVPLFTHIPVISLRAIALANHFGLPATYDTYYLALAEHEECEFWTADTRLWRAVKDEFPWVRNLNDYRPGKP
jgi:predicted nucleic acid-binding protein